MEILDMTCAKCGYEIAMECGDKEETLFRNALGVLKEDGLYAFFLFLHVKEKDGGKEKNRERAPTVYDRLFDFLKRQPSLQDLQVHADPLKAIRDNLSNNLNSLLFAKDLLERVMVYALYHVRAKEKGGS